MLFNHRAEYATYATSAVAVGIGYASAPRGARTLRLVLVALAIVAPGPFFTRAREGTSGIVSFLAAHRLFHPLRVLPLFLLWVGMQRELLARFFEVKVRVRRPAPLRAALETLSDLRELATRDARDLQGGGEHAP